MLQMPLIRFIFVSLDFFNHELKWFMLLLHFRNNRSKIRENVNEDALSINISGCKKKVHISAKMSGTSTVQFL